jgi:hypothetical protein
VYKLIGAIFLTKADGDIGFPVFQLPPNNPIYTCLLNKELAISKFLPVYMEQFFFETLHSPGGVFNVGDQFPFMMFRRLERITIADLRQETELEIRLREQPDELFQNLQIARYLASRDERRYRGQAIRAISKVVTLFSLDAESRHSFISLETSLLSKPEWDSDAEERREELTDDDMYRQFYEYSKEELSEMLENRKDIFGVISGIR